MDARKILGVGDDATQDEIQKAYREKARKHHPDLGGDGWAFQQVQDAYQALTGDSPVTVSSSPESSGKPSSKKQPVSDNELGPSSSQRPTSRPHNPQASKHNRQTTTTDAPATTKGSFLNYFRAELPLQNETIWFIFINCLDIFMTFMLLCAGAMEANPIANFFYKRWEFNGMVAFKLITVAAVCIIAQIVAQQKLEKARWLLYAGSVIVGLVVAYSFALLITKFPQFIGR
jgi:hypothetical protein